VEVSQQCEKKAIHTRIASTQRQHCGKSCTELDNQHADNSSAREQEAIFSRTGIVPWQNLMPSQLGALPAHIFQHQHLPFGSSTHHLPLSKVVKNKQNRS